MTDEEILTLVMNSELLRYHFALNGGTGPVSDKGLAIIREINRLLKPCQSYPCCPCESRNDCRRKDA